MVQTISSQPSASESKPKIKIVKKGTAESESKKDVNEPIAKDGAEAAGTKRKLDEKEEPHPCKKAKDEGINDIPESTEDEKDTDKVEPTAAQKISTIIDEYGTVPLEGLGVDKPLEAAPEILLAIVIDSMLKSTRISHNLAQQTSMKVFEAGYYDIEILSNSSWDERVQVLDEGSYTRYDESTATKLGDLASLVNDKYGIPSMTVNWHVQDMVDIFSRRRSQQPARTSRTKALADSSIDPQDQRLWRRGY
jgi:hypothetical protein